MLKEVRAVLASVISGDLGEKVERDPIRDSRLRRNGCHTGLPVAAALVFAG